MKVAWVTSVYGGYDAPEPPAVQDTEAEYVLVSDRPYECPPWRVVVEPRPQLHPRLGAKFAKCRPDLYADADVYIWTDANVRVADPGFIRWCLTHLGDADIGVCRHHSAPTISDDLAISMTQERYVSLPMHEQVAQYAKDGFPESFGNWWTGLMVRRYTSLFAYFGDAWLAEMVRWTNHCQISFPYVLWQYGLQPSDMPFGWLEGRFGFSAHAAEHPVKWTP